MESKKTLVELDEECRDLVARISAGPEEVSSEDLAHLEAAEFALCLKVDAYSMVLARLESEEMFWKAQQDRCNSAVKAFRTAQVRLKERMKYVLMQKPEKSLQGDLSRFFLAKAAPRLEINEAELSDAFKKTRIEIIADRDKIEATLKEGKVVPGAVFVENVSLREGRPHRK